MKSPNLSALEGLTDVGLRGGVDMRPTLLRVLTDLYAQKLTHTPEEERHYTELALRLLDSVDSATRAEVAARLAQHLSPPIRVMERLASDLSNGAAAPSPHVGRQSPPMHAAAQGSETMPVTGAALDQAGSEAPADSVGTDVAAELNEVFFAASANERRLILLNLGIVAALPAARAGIVPDPTVGRQLEAAALSRKHEEFAAVLTRSLRISRSQAQRIVRDESGEPIVVAAKALNVPRDLLYRILLFVNTAVGHSVERVHALAQLYDEISARVAQDLVTIWQAVDGGADHRPAMHQPLLAEEATVTQPVAATRRSPQTQRRERREAS